MVKDVSFRVVGEDPLDADPPLFANFVAVSHAGNEVQLEFIYLDINQLALRFGQPNEDDVPAAGELIEKQNINLRGRTVAKLVVPVSSFLQLKDHLQGMFTKFEARRNEPRQLEKEAGEGKHVGT
jgi:hypothetical protein